MKSVPTFNEKLWFTMGSHCEGKHFLLGNPHTSKGRMLAWCPNKEISFFVSKLEMDNCSTEAEYWVRGFLAGNEPEPQTNENFDVDFDSTEYQSWLKAIEGFAVSGYWNECQRNCEVCGEALLPSEAKDTCGRCKK